MLQLVLALIKLIAMGALTVIAIVFGIIALIRAKKKLPAIKQTIIACSCIFLVICLWNIDIFHAESTDREKLVDAFRSNFGFLPPASVTEIKVKNTTIYDASVHWMTFTFVPSVTEKIIRRDQPLEFLHSGTPEFDRAVARYLDNKNRPAWAVPPRGRTSAILFKKGFLDHISSEYYLWVDTTEALVHLHVTYSD